MNTTEMVADAGVPTSPPPVVEVIEDVTLFCTPIPAPFTRTLNVQTLLPASVAPASEITLNPGTAVMAPPPHVPVSPLSGASTTSPDGRISVNAIPLSEMGLGLVTMNLTRVTPKNNSICESANAFVIFGGSGTNKLAEIEDGR